MSILLKPFPVFLIGFFLALLVTPLVHSAELSLQDESIGNITIAVFDLSPQGEVEESTAKNVSTLLLSAVKETAVFEVVERDRLEDIQKEQMRQLSGGIEEAVEIGKMSAAEQLLIGSIGYLFGKVVLTVRLVETESGKIIIADTIYTSKEEIEKDITRMAVRLGTKALDFTRKITIPLIETEIEEERYQRAKRYLDVYIQREGLSPSIRSLRERLLPLLAKQYAEEANSLRKDEKFDEAIERIQEALALRIDEEYIRLRDRIFEEQREYDRRLELKREREAQKEKERALRREKMIEEGRLYPVVNYFRELSLHGLHLAPATYWHIDEHLKVPTALGKPGAEIYALGDPFGFRDGGGRGVVNNMASIGANITYIDGDPYSSILITGYLSPYLTTGIKLANLGIVLGLDGGSTFWYNNELDAGYRVMVNGGAVIALELKLKQSAGIFGLIKADYQYYTDDPPLSHPALRMAVGLVF